MSDADRQALAKTLETTDAQDVQGWLGDQIRKAAAVFKGDFDGHPFRGNQWTDSSGTSQGGASGSRGGSEPKLPRLKNIKEGDFVDIDTQSGNYVGTVIGIEADGRLVIDDVDKGEIKVGLKTITHLDGKLVNSPPRTESVEEERKRLGEGARAKEDAKYKIDPAQFAQDTAAARIRGAKEFAERVIRDASPAGKRMIRNADKTQEGFNRAKDELEMLDSSREQLIKDLVNEEGMSPAKAREAINSEIYVAQVAVENSRFFNSEKPEDDSAEAGRQRVKDVGAKLETARRGRERAEREEAASTARRGKLRPVDDDNIDKPLKGEEATEFKAGVKEAKAAIKQTRELIAELRAQANQKATRSMLGTKRLDDVQMALQEAQDETDRFEDVVSSNSKASIRSAVSISTMGADLGETVKGYVRQAASDMKLDVDARREASLQIAADKNFGVSGDKYDVEAAFDYVGN